MDSNPLAGHPLLQPKVPDPVLVQGTQEATGLQLRLADAACAPGITLESLAAVQAAIQKTVPEIPTEDLSGVPGGAIADAMEAANRDPKVTLPVKPTRYIVPHYISEVDLKRITAELEKASKGYPYTVERAEAPKVAEKVGSIAQIMASQEAERRHQLQSRFAAQLIKAVDIVRTAGRPVKFSYIEVTINAPIFQGLEIQLREHSNVRMKRHKNEIYYTWKA